MLARPAVYDNSLQRMIAPGDVVCGGEIIASLATAGNGTITAEMLSSNILSRTGPTGAYTDTTCTAAQLIEALLPPGQNVLAPGTTYRFLFINTVAQAMTLAAGAGVTLGANVNVAASSVKEYLISIVNGTRQRQVVASGANGQAVLSGLTREDIRNLTFGMSVTGTNMPANGTISAINAEARTVTLSGNLTGAVVNGTVTFGPRVTINSLGQSAL